MQNRSYACAALILCTSIAFAQEASSPSPSGGDATAPENNTREITSVTTNHLEPTDPAEGFSLPGGYGSAPLNFTPGQGHFDRPPVTFSTTLQHGYDDNTYNTSGNPLQRPVKGSMVTVLSEGVDLLVSQSRMGLSFSGNLGGQYYWDRESDQFTPNAGVDMLFAYKLSPRAQFSSSISAAYTTQPSFSVLNGLTESNGKGYFTSNAKLDLLYRWTPRFSTDTTYLNYGTYYTDSASKSSNHINQVVGQALRYSFSRLVTGVFEGRVMQSSYDTSTNDSMSYYLLTGADLTLSRRLSASLRAGGMYREFDNSGAPSSSMPYAEGSLNYVLTRNTLLGWQARYGYEDGGTVGGLGKSARTGFSLTHAFNARLRGSASLNYSHTDASENNTGSAAAWSSVSGVLGVQYAYSKHLTLFANYNRMQKTSDNELIEYTKNLYYVGATYEY